MLGYEVSNCLKVLPGVSLSPIGFMRSKLNPNMLRLLAD